MACFISSKHRSCSLISFVIKIYDQGYAATLHCTSLLIRLLLIGDTCGLFVVSVGSGRDYSLSEISQIVFLVTENWSLWGTSVNPGLLYPLSSFFDKLQPFVVFTKQFGEDNQGSSHAPLNLVGHSYTLSEETLLLHVEDLQGKDVSICRSFLLSIRPHILGRLPILCVSVICQNLKWLVGLENDIIGSP